MQQQVIFPLCPVTFPGASNFIWFGMRAIRIYKVQPIRKRMEMIIGIGWISKKRAPMSVTLKYFENARCYVDTLPLQEKEH